MTLTDLLSYMNMNAICNIELVDCPCETGFDELEAYAEITYFTGKKEYWELVNQEWRKRYDFYVSRNTLD